MKFSTFFVAAIAVGMAMFMDVSIGALIAAKLSVLSGLGTPSWGLLLLGAVLAVLPDFDIIFPILLWLFARKNYSGNHHESFMHWPLLVLPVSTFLAWYFGDIFFAKLTLLCVAWHYFHDASIMGVRDGAGWLVRLRPSYWSRFGKVDPSFIPMAQWVKQTWLSPTALAVRETAIGAVALGGAVALAAGVAWGSAVIVAVALGATIFWSVHPRI